MYQFVYKGCTEQFVYEACTGFSVALTQHIERNITNGLQFPMQTLRLGDVPVHNCYSNVDEDMPSPTTTFSHTSSETFSQTGSFGHTNHRIFIIQQSSLESNSSGFGKTKAGGQSGFLRNTATVDIKPSPLIWRVSFPSDHELVDTHEPDVGW